MDLENVLLSDLEANERRFSSFSDSSRHNVLFKEPIHQRAGEMFKDDRMWDVTVTHKAGAVQSTSHPICILSNLTQRGSVMRDLKRGGGNRDIVKHMNAAFKKAALTDTDKSKHFTGSPLTSERLLCKEGRVEAGGGGDGGGGGGVDEEK